MSIDEKAFQQVVDELQIRNLIGRVAEVRDATRRGEATEEDYLEDWTDDSIWESPTMGKWVGREGHLKRAEDQLKKAQEMGVKMPDGPEGPQSYHVVSTTSVRIDGDVAFCESRWLFVSTTGTAGQVQQCGRYLDEVHRTPGGWKMHHRQVYP